MPKPKPRVKVDPSPPKSPTVAGDTTPQHYSAPPPPTIEQQTTQPAFWDAQRHSPPIGGQPEMSTPMNTFYNAAWDESPAQQSTFYSAPPNHQSEPRYPSIPENVRRDTWYSNFTGSTPDRTYTNPVFPWEQQNQRKPDRVFPQDAPAPVYKHTVKQPTQQLAASAQPARPRRASPPTVSPPLSSPTPRSMSEAMASYTNAWDTMPQIQQYIDRVSGRPTRLGMGDLPRQMDLSALKSVPNTPKHEAPEPIRHRTESGDRRSDVSGDGDDEDDGDSQDSNNDSPAIGSNNTGRMDPVLYPFNARYRDRQAQTDRRPVVDAKVQTGGVSPSMTRAHSGSGGLTTPAKPVSRRHSGNGQGQGQSSSSETTPRAGNLLTPPSEHGGLDTSGNRIPFPGNPSATRRSSHNSTGSGGGSSRRPSGMTDSGIPSADQRPTRKFDPSTDPDVRKKDTQQVLSRFMQDASFAGN